MRVRNEREAHQALEQTPRQLIDEVRRHTRYASLVALAMLILGLIVAAFWFWG